MNVKYTVIIEKASEGLGAYAPDLPGCSVAASTKSKVIKLIQEAMVMHLEGLRGEGLPIPEMTSSVGFVNAGFPTVYRLMLEHETQNSCPFVAFHQPSAR